MSALTAPGRGTRRRGAVRALLVGLSALLVQAMVPWVALRLFVSAWPRVTLSLWSIGLLLGLVLTAAHRPRVVGVALVVGTLLGAVAFVASFVWAFITAPGGWD